MNRNARQIARDALARVGARRGFANQELDKAFKRHRDLDPRDRALITEIVYGVLRRRLTLDYIIGRFSRVPLETVERRTLDALRVAVYQIVYLDRIPTAAAVNDAVESVAKRSKGYVNGLLRNLTRNRRDLGFEEIRGMPLRAMSIRHSHPEWLVRRWMERYGEKKTDERLAANNNRPPLTLRVNTMRTTADELIALLVGGGIAASAHPIVPGAINVETADPTRLPGFKAGLFYVQDAASQVAVRLLDPQPGERILDACSAPGGKATQAAEIMGDSGEVIAMDADAMRLKRVRENAARLGLKSISAVRGDAEEPPVRDDSGGFDRVLVDAPCSSIGLLRRQPEIRWRRGLDDLANLAGRQRAILDGAANLVRSGGVLVYAVCSPEPEEGEDVVRAFLADRRDFEPRSARGIVKGPMGRLVGRDGTVRTDDPALHMDSFFVARLDRTTDKNR